MYLIHPFSWKPILILSSHLILVLPNSSSHKFSHQHSLFTSPPSVPSILIHSAPQHSVSSTDHKAPHYAVSCSPMLCHPSQAQHPIHKHRQFGTPRYTLVYKKTKTLTVLYILNFVHCWIKKLEDKTYCRKWDTVEGDNFSSSNSVKVTDQCGLCLSVLLDLWNIAGHVLVLYTDQYMIEWLIG